MILATLRFVILRFTHNFAASSVSSGTTSDPLPFEK